MRVSILTACLPEKADHIDETAHSVAHAKNALGKDGIEVEWILALDGPGAVPADHADAVVRLHRHCGVSATRNAALSLSAGEYLTVLDADDAIEPEGLRACLSLLGEKPDVGWVAGNRVLMDGTRTRHWHRKSYWGRGFLAWDWTSPFPFHPSTIVFRRSLALELGGWPALPAAEDVGFILRMSELEGGMAIPEILSRHREWEERLELSPRYSEEKDLAYRYLEDLLNFGRARRRDPLIARPDLP